MISKCNNCGKIVYVRPSQEHYKHHYCSHACEGAQRKSRYTVYDNRTDMPIIVDGTATECAKVMGIAAMSFHSTRYKCDRGEVKRWFIVKSEETGH